MTEVVFLLLFLTWFSHVHNVALLVAAASGVALPVLLMPLVYALVNGNTSIATGRYHIPFVVSGLGSGLTFVLMLVPGKIHPVAQGFALFGLLFAHSLCMQTFLYTYASIGKRFDPSGEAGNLRGVFAMLSLAIAALAIVFLFDASRDSVRAVAAVAAIVAVVTVATVYFTTVSAMPAYVRLEPRHKRSVKETYSRFCAPLKNSSARILVSSAFMLCTGAAFAAVALPEFVFSYMFKINGGFKPAVLIAAVLVPPVGMFVYRYLKRSGNKAAVTAAVAVASVQLVLTAVVAVSVFVSFPLAVEASVLFSFAAVVGITLATVLVCDGGNNERAESLTNSTFGRYYCFRNCVSAIGIAAGLALACVVRIIEGNAGGVAAAVASCAIYACIILAGTLLGRFGYLGKTEKEKRKRKRSDSEERQVESEEPQLEKEKFERAAQDLEEKANNEPLSLNSDFKEVE